MSPVADGVLPLTVSADRCSCVGPAFLRGAVVKRRYLLQRETSVSSPLRSRNSQAICRASVSSCGLASSLNHVDIVFPRSLAEELLGSGLVPKCRPWETLQPRKVWMAALQWDGSLT